MIGTVADRPSTVAPWPAVVEGVLDRRRRAIAASATGRVLDLGGLGAPLGSYRTEVVESVTLVEPAPRASEPTRPADQPAFAVESVSFDDIGRVGPFDTVVSVLGLALRGDLPGALAAVVAVMDDDARLLFIEPTARPGWVATVTTPLASLVPSAAALHLNRDVPSAVRAQGLSVVSIERFTMPTLIWPLRPFAQAIAQRRPDAAEGAGDTDGGAAGEATP